MIKKSITLFTLILSVGLLAGCATQKPLMSPCPDFGGHCLKLPVNSWQPSANKNKVSSQGYGESQ